MTVENTQINKSAIRNFSIQARNILIKSAVTEAGFYGVTKDGIQDPIQKGMDFEVYETLAGTEKRIFGSDLHRRANLAAAVRQKGFDQVMEETAYTWFNRLIAIRFMEVNKYLPFRMRVLSSDSGSLTPDIVSRSLDVDLYMTEEELVAVQKAKEENRYDEAFRLLFLKACNELHGVLPGLFEETDDYMELLLNLPYTSDGVVRMLVDTIPESNFNVRDGGQVEIIGWLYQYYNTEPKAKAFAKKGKITKEEIPAVTQLFTPDWIVRYMVENSLGRLWIEHLLANGDSRSEQELADFFGWKYYLPEAEQELEVQAQLVQIRAERKDLMPEDILCIDPCQGSGHILVYLFEVLMQIYREEGHSERDAARSILEHNLYGLDIDDRAYQLSYFAVLMKAREYDRMILKKQIEPHVYSIQESNTVDRNQLKYFGANMNEFDKNNALNQLTGLLDTFIDAKEYGSILNVDFCDWDLLRQFVENDRVEGQYGLDAYDLEETQKQLTTLIEIGVAMAQKYHVVITNPPYMSPAAGSKKLHEFVQTRFPNSKFDLFAVFIEKCNQMLICDGIQGMITLHSWMFLSSYEQTRDLMLSNTLINMAHLGTRAFDEIGGEVVQTTSFIVKKCNILEYVGVYCRLIEPKSENGKRILFESKEKNYFTKQKIFKEFPRRRFAYWVSDKLRDKFLHAPLSKYADTRRGLQTGDSGTFIRKWYEPDSNTVDLRQTADTKAYKWFFFNSGGSYRRWYGNIIDIVNWGNDGHDIKATGKAIIPSEDRYFDELVSWNKISSGRLSVRYQPQGIIPGDASPFLHTISQNTKLIYYAMAILNSKVAAELVQVLSPALNFEVGNIAELPMIMDETLMDLIVPLVEENVHFSIEDWNEAEYSWRFKRHPLIEGNETRIENRYLAWKNTCKNRFYRIKRNEQTINEELIRAYDLKGEIEASISDSDITTKLVFDDRDSIPEDLKDNQYVLTKQEAIKSLISYAIGCMFGRYSIDIEGLAYAGGDWMEAYATKYKIYLPDEDAIIPITDEEYFKDDIVSRFVDFIRIVYGEKTLEENLKFIADAIDSKGDTPRVVIRNYFIRDFYKDHCRYYQKRPIYWLFDSGKQNGFKALIYIHRYTPDTVGRIRSKYLHNAQAAIQNALQNSEYIIASTTSATERARETKKRDKYVKQLNELRPYYQALTHIALQRIPMDLDDGVKKNYQLFQNVEISTEGKKKQSINLLAKI